jgi:hypothetical protein
LAATKRLSVDIGRIESDSILKMAALNDPLRNWYALRVAAGREITIANTLRKKGCEVYLPLRTVLKQYSDRVKKSQVALIPGIVFCQFEKDDWLRIIKTPGLADAFPYSQVSAIESARNLALIPERELAILRCLADSRDPIEAAPGVDAGQAAELVTEIGRLPCLILECGEFCRIALRLEWLDRNLILKVPRTALAHTSPPA